MVTFRFSVSNAAFYIVIQPIDSHLDTRAFFPLELRFAGPSSAEIAIWLNVDIGSNTAALT